MISQLETGEGAEAVSSAMTQLSGDDSGAISANAVDRLFGAHDGGELAAYIHEHAPVCEEKEGYDVNQFVQRLFSC